MFFAVIFEHSLWEKNKPVDDAWSITILTICTQIHWFKYIHLSCALAIQYLKSIHASIYISYSMYLLFLFLFLFLAWATICFRVLHIDSQGRIATAGLKIMQPISTDVQSIYFHDPEAETEKKLWDFPSSSPAVKLDDD